MYVLIYELEKLCRVCASEERLFAKLFKNVDNSNVRMSITLK